MNGFSHKNIEKSESAVYGIPVQDIMTFFHFLETYLAELQAIRHYLSFGSYFHRRLYRKGSSVLLSTVLWVDNEFAQFEGFIYGVHVNWPRPPFFTLCLNSLNGGVGGWCGAALEGGASRLISQAGDNFLANIREKTNVRTHDSLCKRILKQKRQDWWNSHHALLFWPLVCLVCLPGNI